MVRPWVLDSSSARLVVRPWVLDSSSAMVSAGVVRCSKVQWGAGYHWWLWMGLWPVEVCEVWGGGTGDGKVR